MARSAVSRPVIAVVCAAVLASSACGKGPAEKRSTARAHAPPAVADPAPAADRASERAERAPDPTCADAIEVYEAGRAVRKVCAGDASAAGLTVIDLGDEWTPSLFGVDAVGAAPPYAKTLVALANEEFGDGPEFDRAKQERYLELYGIFPSFRVLRARLTEEARHACHEGVDSTALGQVARPIDPWRSTAAQRSDKAYRKTLQAKLEAERKRRGLDSYEPLAADRYLGATLREYERVASTIDAVAVAQEHLVCEGLLDAKKIEPGIATLPVGDALKTFQRRHMIVGAGLDEETRAALETDSRELDYRAVLRTLRERVVDATGLLEDGTAGGVPGTVFGRTLDTEAFRGLPREPLPRAPADGVAAATEAAAKALGWTSASAVRAFFDARGPEATRSLRVAIALPPPPAYYGPSMELHAVVDRGDVWYDFPFDKRGNRRAQPVEHRPTVVLYAKGPDGDVPLVRWPTTIGGWKPEKLGPRKIGMAYKESTVGERVWRDIVVTPAWIPPESAPKRDLVRPRPGGGWAVNQDVFGPGYASAYGLVMLVHHRVAKVQGAADPYRDEGIRTHGSVSYESIHHGSSHGCHRLHNHRAIRLANFLVRHREHESHGSMELGYGRSFAWEGKAMKLQFDSRGYRIELQPPVPVEVRRGRIMGHDLAPSLTPKPLPATMAERFTQEMFED